MARSASYRGVLVWNKTRKRDEDGKRIFERAKLRRPESEWERVEALQLRIVDRVLSERVDRVLAARRAAVLRSDKPIGRPHPKRMRFLLSNMLQCSCGANFEAFKGHYVCSRARRKGTCTNRARLPIEKANADILDIVIDEALSPIVIDRIVEWTCRGADPSIPLREERQSVERAIANLTRAIEAGGALDVLIERLREQTARREAIDRELATLVDAALPDPEELRNALLRRFDDWREVLATKHREPAQRVLRHLLGPIVVHDESALPEIDHTGKPIPGTGRQPEGEVLPWSAQLDPLGMLSGLPNTNGWRPRADLNRRPTA